jgi:hypothetical protein
MNTKNLAIFLLLGVSLTLSGCFKSPSEKAGEELAEKMLESQLGGQVEIDPEGGNIKIENDEFKSEVSSQGEVSLPKNFPAELIIADDAKINYASTAGNTTSVTYYTDIDKNDLLSKYIANLDAQGWVKTFEMNDEQTKMVNFEKIGFTGSIIIGNNNDNPEIIKKHLVAISLFDSNQ